MVAPHGGPQPDGGTVTLTEAARQLGVRTDTLRAWAAEGLILGVPHGRSGLRFARSEVQRARAALGFSTDGQKPWPALSGRNG